MAMINGLRSTLAAAVQRSSTSANNASAGSDPSIGNVYMNSQHGPAQPGAGHPAPGAPFNMQQQPGVPFGMFGAPPGSMPGAPPGQMPGAPPAMPPGVAGGVPQGPPQGYPPQQMPQAQQCPHSQGGAMPGSAANDAIVQERVVGLEREIERLKKELRKADEKSNFFRNQVITLQQQVSSMGMPVMGLQEAQRAAGMPEEINRLRTELNEERAEKQALQSAAARSESAAAALQERERELGLTHGRAGDLERELAIARQEISSAVAQAAVAQSALTSERERADRAERSADQAQRERERERTELQQQLAQQPQQDHNHHQKQQQQISNGANMQSRVSTGQLDPTTPARSMRSGYGLGSNIEGTAPGSPSPHQQRGGSCAASPLPIQVNFRGDPLNPNENPGGTKRALIIGCDYPGKIGTLRAGVADAQQWARFFMKRCAFHEQDIRVLSDDPAQYQQRARPEAAVSTRDNILRGLQWLTARSAPGDQIFFIFCGHGAQIVTEEYAGQKLCENACVPADAHEGGDHPRVVSDTDLHKALLAVPSGAQATLIYDSCHAGKPLDRSGLDYLTEYVGRGRVDYEKLRGHPVLPRFLELQQWKARSTPAEAVRESVLRCQCVQWAACSNAQFCVELPIDERPRGVFTYILISALLKVGVQAPSGYLLKEAKDLTAQLKGRWRLQQDVQFSHGQSTSESQTFLRK